MNHQLAVLMGKTPAEAHVEAISLDSLQLPAGSAGQPAVVAGAPASGHSRRRSVAAPSQRQRRGGDGQPLSADRAFRKRGRYRHQLHQRQAMCGMSEHRWRSPSLTAERCGRRSAKQSQPTRKRAALISRRCCRLFAKWRTRCAPSSTMRKLCRRDRSRHSGRKRLPDRVATLRRRRHQPTRAARCAAPASANCAGSGCLPESNRYSDSATLFQALGGGWWNEKQPTPSSGNPPGRVP